MASRLHRLLRLVAVGAAAVVGAAGATGSERGVVTLDVDAREAPRRIFHARLVIPAQPGPLTLLYPKWIPGEHGPTGPINDLAGLRIAAGGGALSWRRDLNDMYSIHCDVPAGADRVEVELDYLSPGGSGFSSSGSSTARLAVIDWHLMLLYPSGTPADELIYAARVRLPTGWQVGGALDRRPAGGPARGADDSAEGGSEGAWIAFEPVSLTTLIDAPMVAGRHYRRVALTPQQPPAHFLDMIADSEAALAIREEQVERLRRLTAEAGALCGVRHYQRYHFLLTLSEHVGHFGLEHHECSDNRVPERYLIDDDHVKLGDDLLAHELFHSWCGKHRRPADLTAPDYQQALRTDLLWVYEGLTTYYGSVLAARCGLFTPENYRDHLASVAAELAAPGRTWRPLRDTADAAQALYNAGTAWRGWRRDVDFYEEAELIWLEADVLIRTRSGGQKSLDDFCRAFLGGPPQPRRVRTYTYDDVLAAMNEVQSHDWKGYFSARLSSTGPQPPLAGVEGAGWRVAFRAEPNDRMAGRAALRERTDARFSLGFWLDKDGVVGDCLPESPAYRAGIGPGMKLVAVNGRRWSAKVLDEALRSAQASRAEMELLIENADYFSTHRVAYFEGPRFPHLERDESKPDLLADIIRPLAGGP